MGRRRTSHPKLPPQMYVQARGKSPPRYYYGKAKIALGNDWRAALRKYAELHGADAEPGTFADAVAAYRKDELPKKAAKTRSEYGRQLATLVLAFGEMALGSIRPKHVGQYLRVRGKSPIAATREKALLSAVFNYARSTGLTDAANPCAGIRGVKAKRDRYVKDGELVAAMNAADPMVAAFTELCYLTGQRPSDVLRMQRSDIEDGALCVRQAKTGAKVRIAIVGPLEPLLARLTAKPDSLFLIHRPNGMPYRLQAIRRHFSKLGLDWQIRDLRAKAASDSLTSRDAQRLLGHAAASTTDGYIRRRAGEKVTPITRKVK